MLVAIASIASQSSAMAQPVFRVTLDTATAKAGDTVTVFARYSFDPSGPHNINSYSAHIDWDTTELHLIAFVLDGTATPPSDTLGLSGTSHHGITTYGPSEIDLSNPILFGIKFVTDKRLGDTVFLHWDTTLLMFDPTEGAGTVVRENGWVRTPTLAAHFTIHIPGNTVSGYSDGYSPDSVRFRLPIIVSNLSAASMTMARVSFDYDSSQLLFVGAIGDSLVTIDSVSSTLLFGGLDSGVIVLSSRSAFLSGDDTLVTAEFIGLVGMDSVCQEFSNVQLRALNANGLIGNTDYTADSVCVDWAPLDDVRPSTTREPFEIYPNPASNEVWMKIPGMSDPASEDQATLEVVDAVGRTVWMGPLMGLSWLIPSTFPNGAYELHVRTDHHSYQSAIIVEKP
jgi:hypothetical protein